MSKSVRFVLSSPWTMNLCADLRNVIDNDCQTRYSELLQNRITTTGKAILEEVKLYNSSSN